MLALGGDERDIRVEPDEGAPRGPDRQYAFRSSTRGRRSQDAAPSGHPAPPSARRAAAAAARARSSGSPPASTGWATPSGAPRAGRRRVPGHGERAAEACRPRTPDRRRPPALHDRTARPRMTPAPRRYRARGRHRHESGHSREPRRAALSGGRRPATPGVGSGLAPTPSVSSSTPPAIAAVPVPFSTTGRAPRLSQAAGRGRARTAAERDGHAVTVGPGAALRFAVRPSFERGQLAQRVRAVRHEADGFVERQLRREPARVGVEQEQVTAVADDRRRAVDPAERGLPRIVRVRRR